MSEGPAASYAAIEREVAELIGGDLIRARQVFRVAMLHMAARVGPAEALERARLISVEVKAKGPCNGGR